ncbi:TonB-dependent receptor domain-containing protein [uncultured Bacteroides sp.]|uniref:TonB-dependent receptor domain-containing protein n=1 Tax=uncultured Bacteroides sp. TaxID=162156 RepID=UPI002AAC2FE4|nr:TonB-dependent receptor [uncultured Bacteroides sp.]
MKRLLLGTLLLVISICSYAASEELGNIKGMVIDSKTKEGLQFVNVSIKTKTHASLLKGGITDQNGSFILGGLKEGTYIVSVSYIGYKAYEKEFAITSSNKNVNLKMISLAEDSHELKGVEVTGQKSQMKFEIDKKVFNVDQNIASAGGSASDVLSNIPSVEVNNDGDVSLRGNSNVTVWINGKASGLSADNRAQILEQMPAESIEKIEVITNPSAKYSPDGTAGIINIVLKQDRKAGYFGSVQTGADTKGGYNGSFNINYSSSKLDVYANAGYRHHERTGGGYTNRTNTQGTETKDDDTYLNQISDQSGDHSGLFLRGGVTYHYTPKDHFTLGGFGMFGDMNQNNTIDYLSNVPVSYYKSNRLSNSDNSMNGGNIELGYKHDFTKDSYLDFTASYNKWGMDNTSLYNQTSFYTDKTTSSYQHQLNNMNRHEWEFQLDYQNKINDNTKFEAGYKGNLGRENSPVKTYSGLNESSAVFDNSLYNRFIYNQDIHALYTTYSGRISKLGYQLGLRGEYSKVNTRSEDYANKSIPFSTDYFSLFPSAFISYALPDNNEVQLNYTRRISRPWGGQLNSFKNITDSTNISFGNPELNPEYSNAFELNYIKNWESHMLSFSGYYRTTDDVIQSIRYLDGNVMKTTYDNVAKSQSAGVELVGKDKLLKILDLTTTVNLFYYKLDGFSYLPEGSTTPVVGNASENFSWNARMIANVLLPQSISLQVTGGYNARQIVAQGTQKASYSLDAGLRKSFMNKKFSLSINARDILNSRIQHTLTSGTGFIQDSKSWRNGRQVGFTLTYNFGNMRAKNNKLNKPGDENMSMPMNEE